MDLTARGSLRLKQQVSIDKWQVDETVSSLYGLALGRMALALLAAGAFTVAGSRKPPKPAKQWERTLGRDLGQRIAPAGPRRPGLSNSGFNNQTLRQIVHVSVGGPGCACGYPLLERVAW